MPQVSSVAILSGKGAQTAPPMRNATHQSTKAAFSPREFCAAFGLGLTTFYAEVSAGRLRARKVGARTIVLASEARRWADALPSLHDADAI